MKTRKIFSFLTAAVMTAASLPVLSGFAADSTITLGDVDQDGYITGHDSALVSRYLNVDGATLTEAQLAVADINQDGVVDQTDADLIHAQETYGIGNLDETAEIGEMSLFAALRALQLYSGQIAGGEVEIADTAEGDVMTISQLDYNLLDVDADGEVGLDDAYSIAVVNAVRMAGGGSEDWGKTGYYRTGRYDLFDNGYYEISDSIQIYTGTEG